MAHQHEADRLARRNAFWDGFWETFASPFAIVTSWFAPREELDADERINRILAKYGVSPLQHIDAKAGSAENVWRAVGNYFQVAIEKLEHQYGEQIRAAEIEEAKRFGDGSAVKI